MCWNFEKGTCMLSLWNENNNFCTTLFPFFNPPFLSHNIFLLLKIHIVSAVQEFVFFISPILYYIIWNNNLIMTKGSLIEYLLITKLVLSEKFDYETQTTIIIMLFLFLAFFFFLEMEKRGKDFNIGIHKLIICDSMKKWKFVTF